MTITVMLEAETMKLAPNHVLITRFECLSTNLWFLGSQIILSGKISLSPLQYVRVNLQYRYVALFTLIFAFALLGFNKYKTKKNTSL